MSVPPSCAPLSCGAPPLPGGRLVLVLSVLVGLCAALPAAAQPAELPTLDGVVLIKLREPAAQTLSITSEGAGKGVTTSLPSLNRLHATYASVKMRRVFRPAGQHEARHVRYGLHRWYRIEYTTPVEASAVAEAYALDPNIEVAAPIYEKRRHGRVEGFLAPDAASSSASLPDDAHFGEQWSLHNTGQTNRPGAGEIGTPDADINLPDARVLATGHRSVVVQVVDSGIDPGHPDLAANLWVNPGEIPGNGIDDDHNGYVDDVHGYNFADDIPSPAIVDPASVDNSHGQHVSGIIAATANNGEGITGIAGGDGTPGSGARIMTAVTFGAAVDGFAEAIVYGADNGAVISNQSWGYATPGVYEPAVLDAIAYFVQEAGQYPGAPMTGGLIVGSAGNANSDQAYYPAYFEAVLAVASTEDTDRKSTFSNFGEWVDLAAPGGQFGLDGILSTVHTQHGGYATFSGTSMAAPHVAGAAALIASHLPGLPASQVRALLTNTGRPIDPLNPGYALGRRLDAWAALQGPDGTAPAAIADLAATLNPATFGAGVLLTWTATGDDGAAGTAARYDLRYSLDGPLDEASFAEATPVAGLPYPSPAGTPETFAVDNLPFDAELWFALRTYDEFGNPGGLSNGAAIRTGLGPQFLFSPAALDASVLAGSAAERSVTVENTGADTLAYTFFGFASLALTSDAAVRQNQTEPPVADATHGKGEVTYDLAGEPVVLGAGGPDAFGYTWIDSQEPGGPAFDWYDIAAIGTPLPLTDESTVEVTLPFLFPFYGTYETDLWVGSNGYLSFSEAAPDFSNDPLPNGRLPNALIAPFWDDLVPGDERGGRVHAFHDVLGRRFVIQYTSVPHYTASYGANTFQVHLYEDGTILFQYLDVATTSSASVGLENETGGDGLQVAFNTSYLSDSLAIALQYAPPYLSVAPTQGRIAPGASDDVTVRFDGSALPVGPYGFTLQALVEQQGAQALTSLPTQWTVESESFPFTVYPASISEALRTDTSLVRTLTLTNMTDLPQPYRLDLRGLAVVAPPFTPQVAPDEYAEWSVRQQLAVAGRYPEGSATASADPVPPDLLRAALPPPRLASAPLGLAGYTTALPGAQTKQIIQFDLGVPDAVAPLGPAEAAYAGDFGYGRQDRFFVITAIDYQFLSVSTADGTSTPIGTAAPATTGERWTELATDPTTGVLYGSTYRASDQTSSLYTLDPATGTATLIGPIEGAPLVIAIALDGAGQLWGHEITQDVLVTIDKTTGAATTIGPTGFDANFAQGMDVDLATGRLYMAAYNQGTGESELRVADLHTGATTRVGPLGDGSQVGYLALASTGFLQPGQLGGTLAPGASVDLPITLDARGLYEDTFEATLAVAADVAGQPEQVVPITVAIDADPALAPLPDTLAFDTTFVNLPATRTVLLSNTGRADLEAALTFDGSGFSAPDGATVTLFAGETRALEVTFTPEQAGDYTATMAIATNDPARPSHTIALSGRGLPAPAARITPEVFEVQAYPGLSYTQALTVRNTGEQTLTYLGTETDVIVPQAALDEPTPFFAESFDEGIPASWSTEDVAGEGVIWTTNDTQIYNMGNFTGSSGAAATACSDCFGGQEVDAALRTPTLIAPATNVVLSYTANYQNFATRDRLELAITVDSGETWATVLAWQEDHPAGGLYTGGGEAVTVDLSPYLEAGDAFQLRWRYYDPLNRDYDWYAQIDDVALYVRYEWFRLAPEAGTIAPGDSTALTLAFDATGLTPGTYHLTLRFATNDPLAPTVSVPVTYTVIGSLSVSTPLVVARPNDSFVVPIDVESLDQLGVTAYDLELTYDPALVEPAELITEGTLSADATAAMNVEEPGRLAIAAFRSVPEGEESPPALFSLQGAGTLCGIRFQAKAALGAADLRFSSIRFNEGDPPASGTTSPVRIEPLYGDASLNLRVTSYDASLVLQHSVGRLHLDGAAWTSADVSGNGQVSAFDASLIQQYILQLIPGFPVEQGSKTRQTAGRAVALGRPVYDAAEQVWRVPLRLAPGAAGVYGLDLTLPGLPAGWTLDRFETAPADGWEARAHQHADRASLALAGPTPAREGNLGALVFAGPAHPVAPLLTAEARVNEGTAQPIRAAATDAPQNFALQQNYPNPFNPSTAIRYALPSASPVRLIVYNMLGQVVRTLVDGEQRAGRYQVIWDGRTDTGGAVSSGTYLYRLEADGFVQTRRLTLLK